MVSYCFANMFLALTFLSATAILITAMYGSNKVEKYSNDVTTLSLPTSSISRRHTFWTFWPYCSGHHSWIKLSLSILYSVGIIVRKSSKHPRIIWKYWYRYNWWSDLGPMTVQNLTWCQILPDVFVIGTDDFPLQAFVPVGHWSLPLRRERGRWAPCTPPLTSLLIYALEWRKYFPIMHTRSAQKGCIYQWHELGTGKMSLWMNLGLAKNLFR